MLQFKDHINMKIFLPFVYIKSSIQHNVFIFIPNYTKMFKTEKHKLIQTSNFWTSIPKYSFLLYINSYATQIPRATQNSCHNVWMHWHDPEHQKIGDNEKSRRMQSNCKRKLNNPPPQVIVRKTQPSQHLLNWFMSLWFIFQSKYH